MTDDWQEMNTAPKGEKVLVCETNCDILVATQCEGDIYDPGSGKTRKGLVWRIERSYNANGGAYYAKPRMWQPLPLPPKHLYERKLTADLLEKQIAELRS